MRNENERPTIPGYVTIKDAAKILGVSANRVYTYVEEGRLPSAQAAHVIMIPLEALKDFKSQLSGRPRTTIPIWRISPEENAVLTTTIVVRIRPSQRGPTHQHRSRDAAGVQLLEVLLHHPDGFHQQAGHADGVRLVLHPRIDDGPDHRLIQPPGNTLILLLSARVAEAEIAPRLAAVPETHTRLFTIGKPPLPAQLHDWVHTRQPVPLEHWPVAGSQVAS